LYFEEKYAIIAVIYIIAGAAVQREKADITVKKAF